MDNTQNSCLMLAIGLHTPVDLGCIFDTADLKDTGVELDSHITLLYAQDKILPRENLLSDIETILGDDFEDFIRMIKIDNKKPVLSMFELGLFENDSDYVILKLRKDNYLYERLNLIHLSLKTKYEITGSFLEYTPHITLAELEQGFGQKYMTDERLKLLLEDSVVDFEDLLVSYGITGEKIDRKKYYLTQYRNVERYFRLENLKKSARYLDNNI